MRGLEAHSKHFTDLEGELTRTSSVASASPQTLSTWKGKPQHPQDLLTSADKMLSKAIAMYVFTSC